MLLPVYRQAAERQVRSHHDQLRLRTPRPLITLTGSKITCAQNRNRCCTRATADCFRVARDPGPTLKQEGRFRRVRDSVTYVSSSRPWNLLVRLILERRPIPTWHDK